MITCGILAEDISRIIPPPKTDVITDDLALETYCTEILPPTTWSRAEDINQLQTGTSGMG